MHVTVTSLDAGVLDATHYDPDVGGPQIVWRTTVEEEEEDRGGEYVYIR